MPVKYDICMTRSPENSVTVSAVNLDTKSEIFSFTFSSLEDVEEFAADLTAISRITFQSTQKQEQTND